MSDVEVKDWWENYIKADMLKREKLTKELLEYTLGTILPKESYKRGSVFSFVNSYFDDLATKIEGRDAEIERLIKEVNAFRGCAEKDGPPECIELKEEIAELNKIISNLEGVIDAMGRKR